MLITPDPHEEVRWVIRQIAHKAETGTPFHRVAVLYGAATPYNTLVREELQLSAFPCLGQTLPPGWDRRGPHTHRLTATLRQRIST